MYQLSRRNMRRYGGYVVHFGVVLVVIGLAGAAFNQEKEQEMGKGDKLQIGHYTLVGEEYTEDDNANYRSQAALLEVYKDGKFLTRLNPEERFFKASGGQPVHIVANHSTLREDLYVVYEGQNPDTDHPIIKVFHQSAGDLDLDRRARDRIWNRHGAGAERSSRVSVPVRSTWPWH